MAVTPQVSPVLQPKQPRFHFGNMKPLWLIASTAAACLIVGLGIAGVQNLTREQFSSSDSNPATGTASSAQAPAIHVSPQSAVVPSSSGSDNASIPLAGADAPTQADKALAMLAEKASKDSAVRQMQTSSMPSPVSIASAQGPNMPSLDRQVHREATLTVETKDPEAASDQVTSTIKDAGGFVASSNMSTDPAGLKSSQMTIRVPVGQFDTVVAAIEKLGSVKSKNITGDDITAKVSDANSSETVIEADTDQADVRLAGLGRHATVEERDNDRQLHIELAEARARVELMTKLSALSDITLTLTQTPQPKSPVAVGMWGDVHGNASAALQTMLGIVSAVLSCVVWVAAFVPIWGPIVLLGWYVNRKWREVR